MPNNQHVNKVIYNGTTLIDISDSTVTADKIKSGYSAYNAAGQKINGSYNAVDILPSDTSFATCSNNDFYKMIKLHDSGLINIKDYWHAGDIRISNHGSFNYYTTCEKYVGNSTTFRTRYFSTNRTYASGSLYMKILPDSYNYLTLSETVYDINGNSRNTPALVIAIWCDGEIPYLSCPVANNYTADDVSTNGLYNENGDSGLSADKCFRTMFKSSIPSSIYNSFKYYKGWKRKWGSDLHTSSSNGSTSTISNLNDTLVPFSLADLNIINELTSGRDYLCSDNYYYSSYSSSSRSTAGYYNYSLYINGNTIQNRRAIAGSAYYGPGTAEIQSDFHMYPLYRAVI